MKKISQIHWRTNIILASRDVSKVMEPMVFVELVMDDGMIESFEIPQSKFHDVRQNVALLIREADAVKRKGSNIVSFSVIKLVIVKLSLDEETKIPRLKLIMTLPIFPNLTPRIVDPLWFNTDRLSNDESELLQLEHEYKTWLNKITQKDADIIPIGKTATEREEEDDDDEDEEDSNDDEESESQEEEDEDMEVDVSFDRGETAPPAET